MLIFISGSVNAGKSTTAERVAQKLGAEFIDFDKVADDVPGFQLEEDIPKVIKLGIERINKLTDLGKTVVASYVVRPEDYEMLERDLKVKDRYYFTLAPKLEVAQSDRGRGLNKWEVNRIKYHYDTGIATPAFGHIIDNSDLSLEETVDKIILMVRK